MKKVAAISLSLTTYLSLALPAFAQSSPIDINPCPRNQAGFTNFFSLCNLSLSGGVISALITVAFIIAVILALFFLIFGGIKWITSGGDKAKVEEARGTIVAALVGLVIVFLSYFILRIVLNFFNLDLGNLRIPKITG